MDLIQEPLVFVIVVNYRQRDLTDRCIDSLHRLEYRNFRIALVDNGSQDGSAEYFSSRHPGILLVQNEENLGFAGGVNAALRRIDGHNPSYVWLLNNDAIAEPQALTELIRTALSDPEIAATGSVVLEPFNVQVWGGGRVNFISGLPSHYHSPVNSDRIDYLTGASLLLQWKALKKSGFLDERFFMYWEDADLCYRLRASGWSLAVSEKSRVHHNVSTSAGFQSALWDFHFTASSIVFFRSHSQHPFLPIFISTLGRFTRRCLQRRWSHARAIWNAVIAGNIRIKANCDA